jgi:hypothetical protein
VPLHASSRGAKGRHQIKLLIFVILGCWPRILFCERACLWDWVRRRLADGYVLKYEA